MLTVSTRCWWWGGLNAAGMAVYLWLASNLWVRPGEEAQPGGPGDAFYWFFTLLPILAVFLVLGAATLSYLFIEVPKPQRRAALVLWVVVAGLWCATVAYDRHRSVRTIDARYSGSVVPTPLAFLRRPAPRPAASAT